MVMSSVSFVFFVCLSAVAFESLDLESTFWCAGTLSESSGQVRISRSSGQGQGHRSQKRACVYPVRGREVCLKFD